MSDFLETMRAASAARAEGLLMSTSVSDLKARALSALEVRPLRLSEFDVIAEIKTRSPSEGQISASATSDEVIRRARMYETEGAACISVLTEPDSFGGRLEHLRAASESVDIPVMRKDFLIHPAQILEARCHGASGVLLIATILDDGQIEVLIGQARELGMFALLESFDEKDLERSLRFASGDVLIGLNCRNLRSLAVETGRFIDLAGKMPDGVTSVAESGMADPADVRHVAGLGYRAALVGTALMRSPEGTLAEMIAAGREAVPCH